MNSAVQGLTFLKKIADRFAAVPLVGLDLGSTQVKAVEIAQVDGTYILRHATIIQVPQKNAERYDFGLQLKRSLQNAGILSSKVAVGLASPEAIAKAFDFPVMTQKELRGAVRLEAEQGILNGHTFEETVLDWHLLPSRSPESVRGLLAVVPKKVVEGRLKAVRKLGFNPRVVDFENLALWNAYWVLVGSLSPVPQTILLMNIGANVTNLVIARNSDELILARDFYGGAHGLASGQEQDWVDEVRDSLGYARSKGGLRQLDSVCLTGGGSNARAVELLKPFIQVPVSLWNPWNHMEVDASVHSVNEEEGRSLALAIGLALRKSL